jgi:transcriptional/translational regulatory protein YebC/TACO1
VIALEEDTPRAEVFCQPVDLEALDAALKAQGYQVEQVELRWVPSNTVLVEDGDQARLLLKLIDALEDLEDVQSVTTNVDLAEDLLTAMAG